MIKEKQLDNYEILFCDFESLILNKEIIGILKEDVKIYITIQDFQAFLNMSKINTEDGIQASKLMKDLKKEDRIRVYIPDHVRGMKKNAYCEDYNFLAMVRNIVKGTKKKGAVISKQPNIQTNLKLLKIKIPVIK